MQRSRLLLIASSAGLLLVAGLTACSAGGGATGGSTGAGAGFGAGTSGGGPGLTNLSVQASDGGDCVVSVREMGPRQAATGTNADCNLSVSWASDLDAGDAGGWTPPTTESFACPANSVRVHVRDIWSPTAAVRLQSSKWQTTAAPVAVVLNPNGSWTTSYAARVDAAHCDWYSVCMPTSVTSAGFWMNPVGPAGCASNNNGSGNFVLSTSQINGASDVWLDYRGAASAIDTAYGAGTVGTSAFDPVTNKADATLAPKLCATSIPDDSVPTGFVKLHVRWPWGDPAKTGYAGTDCESMDNLSTPPFPSSIRVELGTVAAGCSSNLMPALLEFADGNCPWYDVLLPKASWVAGQTITVSTSDRGQYTTSSGVVLTSNDVSASEYWLAYHGPQDLDTGGQGSPCVNWSTRADSYAIYHQNPGPGYAHCGGDANVTIDPCNPPVPSGYSTVHFRYMWAGQKTFTYFPSPAFMPKYITFDVDGTFMTCFREADRPWFNCAVPNTVFKAGATWVASEKPPHLMYPANSTDPGATAEWNTVLRRAFPATPGEYWIRWTYAKPDMSDGEFTTYSYYPDGTNGDWSATGSWQDQTCAPKPPAVAPTVGYGGWFPYAGTKYAYPYGISLAATFSNASEVQSLMNAFVQERYELWKKHWVHTDPADTCGQGTARVDSGGWPGGTVSEGQGYGMAISAAIGDKATFTSLWNFARHYLSQGSRKYCGGLMGWKWDSPANCRPLDVPCDIEKETCSGNGDSAFDGDVDIGIGLVFAARQWPEFTSAAINWIQKMECEVNTQYDQWNYGTKGDTDGKNCQNYPNKPCSYQQGTPTTVNLSYYPPGYFRVFGDFLQAALPSAYSASDKAWHQAFWYKTAETVYVMYERCYDQAGINPGLVADWGTDQAPCSVSGGNYDWSRALWRVGVDAAWFGNRKDLPEVMAKSSSHYPAKSQMQAKIDNIQEFYNNFHVNNPTVPHANIFSTICQNLYPDGAVKGCDPALGHNSYFVNTAMTAYVSLFDDDGKTTPDIRRQAVEEAMSTTVENDQYYQETIGVYTMLFLSGNFPNPLQAH